MSILVVILLTIILLLIIYLFFLEKEIIRIRDSLDEILNIESNKILHSEFGNKELNKLLQKINEIISHVRNKKLNLERKNNSLKKEITNITHDLRTPLTSALGYIDLVLKSNLSEYEEKKELKIIENRLLRLNELIDSFFEFSIITRNTNKIDMKKVNLVAIIEECISHYYDDFNKNNRKIIFENEIRKCQILSNEEMLKRVIDNLISNSFKHSSSNLMIKLSKKNNGTILLFENEIVDANLDTNHIFDEFYTSDISRTKGNTGLGLAIAKQFIESLNGKIYAKKNNQVLSIVIELL